MFNIIRYTLIPPGLLVKRKKEAIPKTYIYMYNMNCSVIKVIFIVVIHFGQNIKKKLV